LTRRFSVTASSFCCLLAAALSLGTPAFADPLDLPPKPVAEAAPASRYARLTREEALAELRRRGIAFAEEASAPGVVAPIRLSGPLHGVLIHSSLPRDQWKTTPFEILDARLALALDDFAAVLANHDVTEVIHFTMYRPNDDVQEGKEGTKDIRTRHPGGMAIDVGGLRKRTGAILAVESHWPSGIGEKTCGPLARRLPGRRGRELKSIVCEAKDLRIFHAILTPHFNRAHRDHVHLEIKPDTAWFLVH
jgi:hypothetical protein